MQIKFVRAWRTVPIGAVRQFPDGAANVLIRRGIAKEPESEAEGQKIGSHKRNRKRV